MTINGRCDDGFSEVRREFERNMLERGEAGASVCVKVGGRTVVDLWGGVVDESGAEWAEDSVCLVWSCTKGATALCAHILVDRGLLDLDELVGTYWPEYACAGKETTTVRMVLSHQAGVAHVRAPLEPGGVRNWDRMVETIAAEAPFWEPGTRLGYHALTFGWLVGELVRRVDGRSVGQFFAEEVAGPLGLDFWIGTPDSEHHRIAPSRPPAPPDGTQPLSKFHMAAMTDPTSPGALMMLNSGGFVMDPNHPEDWRAEIPAANGVTNGRGLAGMYEPLALGGRVGEVGLVSADAISTMAAVAAATEVDACLYLPTRFSLGFMKSIVNRDAGAVEDVVVMSETAFGHAGMGGALGFCDPAHGLAFGYAMNQQGGTMLLNDRGQSLVDATYRSLGMTSRASGSWR